MVVLALILSACAVQNPAASPADDAQVAQEATPAAEEETEEMADAGSEAEFERILACVEQNFPAESYFTNELLPDLDAAWEPMDCESIDQIKVGMSWILNDGGAPWYNAVELGFFKDLCLEVELLRGGPGFGHLQSLVDGEVDFAASAGGGLVPAMIAGPAQADIVAVGALINHSPYIWLGLDHETPPDQRSSKRLTPQDFVGKKVGIHEGEGYFFDFFSHKYDIGADQVELVVTGFTPDPVLAGEMDYTAGWLINEPRFMEEQGYMNWVAFQFSQWGWDDYSEVMVVRRETLAKNPELVRRYVAAVSQGLAYLLENPEASAEIAVKYGVDAPLTVELALRRFELMEPLVTAVDQPTLGLMSAERWNSQVASMVQFGQLELAACK